MGLFSTNHYHKTEVIESGPSRVDVHEHRAPTDESIRLAHEMEEKIKKQIIGEIKFEDNILNAVCLIYQNPHAVFSDKYSMWLKFSINGYEYEIEEKIDKHQSVDINILKIVEDKALSHIVNHVFKHLKVGILEDLKLLKSEYRKNQILK